MIEDTFTILGGHGGHRDDPVKPIPTVVPTPTKYQTASEHGMRALWVVFAVMLLSSIIFSARAWRIPLQRRVYHVVTTLATIVTALSYFAMASGDGNAFSCHKVADHHGKHVPTTYHDVCRQVLWARYVDWAITTPLVLLNLCLLAGVSGGHTLMVVAADLIMVLSGLFSAFGHEHSAQKWGWYAIGCVAYIFVIWHIAINGRSAVQSSGAKTKKLYASLSIYTLVLFAINIVVSGVAFGARKVTVDTEIIVYAIIDLLVKPVFGIWLLVANRKNPETNVEVDGYWATGARGEGRIRIGGDEGGA